LDLERSLWARGFARVVGVDEAGVGPLSGPVVAAAVRLPISDQILDRVRDSKLIAEAEREDLFERVCETALAVGVGAASVAEVDALNVLRASHLAMARALRRVGGFDLAIVDGRSIKDVELGPHLTLVDADASCYSVACASIVAKVTRDRMMARLARRYPAYGWERNAGYGTPEHRRALLRHGPTPYHRTTFGPVREALARQLGQSNVATPGVVGVGL
jgi:ribonuclease HII